MKHLIKRSAAALIVAAVALTGCKEDDPVRVSGISLSTTMLTLAEGGSETLAAAITPADAENQAVTWAVAAGESVTVDAAGKITAVKAGEATITVTTEDGGKTASCAVTVTTGETGPVAVTGVTLNKSTLTLPVSGSETLVATITPDNAVEKTVEWTSSNEAVATVAGSTVTAIAPGEAVITVTAMDGGFTASCTVTVSEPVPMILTTAMEGNVTIYLAGTGTAVIDWGDGSTPETATLSSGTEGSAHTFSGTTPHTIVVDGQNITLLSCSNLQLTALDVTSNTALTYLWCSNNRLTALDVTKNTALTYLHCQDNRLTSLDVTNNTVLTNLWCNHNQLTALDVTNNMALTDLACFVNQLTSLDVRTNTALTQLTCYWNQLTSLDVSTNTALASLNCNHNQLTAEGLNALFGTLHANAGSKSIYVYNNPGSFGCDLSIATAKGWTVVDN